MPTQPSPPVAAYGSWTPFYQTNSSVGGSSSSSSGSPSINLSLGDTPDPHGARVVFFNSAGNPNFSSTGGRGTCAHSTSTVTNNNSASAGAGKRSSSKSRPRALARESSSLSRSSSRSQSPRRLKLKSSHSHSHSHSHRGHRMVCHDCGTTDTPQWRLGVNGPGTLCNVCGLLFAKRAQRQISQFH